MVQGIGSEPSQTHTAEEKMGRENSVGTDFWSWGWECAKRKGKRWGHCPLIQIQVSQVPGVRSIGPGLSKAVKRPFVETLVM